MRSRPIARRRTGWLPALILGAGAALGAAAPPEQLYLEELLRGMDRATYLYLDSALRFACTETIAESMPGGRRVHRFEYLFVYDKGQGFRDYRTVVRKKQAEQVSPEHEGVGLYLERAYMWVLIFHGTRQARFHYQLAGGETVQGVPTLRVQFEPIPPCEEGINDWSGTAWIDPSTYQIVKVEASKTKDSEEAARMEKDADSILASPSEGPGRSYRVERAVTEFSVIKNGMRFPGEVRIRSTLYYLPRRPQSNVPEVISEVQSKQSYSKYRFYGVRTFEEVQELLSPGKAPARPSP